MGAFFLYEDLSDKSVLDQYRHRYEVRFELNVWQPVVGSLTLTDLISLIVLAVMGLFSLGMYQFWVWRSKKQLTDKISSADVDGTLL